MDCFRADGVGKYWGNYPNLLPVRSEGYESDSLDTEGDSVGSIISAWKQTDKQVMLNFIIFLR